jgi:hypothetical protein
VALVTGLPSSLSLALFGLLRGFVRIRTWRLTGVFACDSKFLLQFLDAFFGNISTFFSFFKAQGEVLGVVARRAKPREEFLQVLQPIMEIHSLDSSSFNFTLFSYQLSTPLVLFS